MRQFNISIKAFLLFTIITGIFYPLIITCIAQLIFPQKANGSLVSKENITIGSALIGQKFDSIIYFSSRPSAIGYNPLPSGGSNYGLTNTRLKDLVYYHQSQFIIRNKLDLLTKIPSEMLFSSASGIDPHISPKAAFLQVERVAQARNFNSDQKQMLEQLIKCQIEEPQLLCFGQERVNVLLLNLEVDKIK
jgi:potassium-transporting ATPase KdpC subunit